MNLINDFTAYLSRELNYSGNTVAAYRRDLLQWADFATSGNTDSLVVDDVTTSDVRLWTASLAKSGIAPRSIRRKVQSLRSFFRFLMRNGIVASNPASDIILARLPKDLPVYIRQTETMDLIDNSTIGNSDFEQLRDRLILNMFYSTGMRCSELITLLDANVDSLRRELKVHGKRNKDRLIPYGEELAEMIERYRKLRDSDPATAICSRDRDATFFVRSNGLPLYRKAVYNIVHTAMLQTGVHARRLSPHVLRHSFATDMLNDGAPITSVQQLLGHSSLVSTQVYTHITYRELQQNYQLAHPRAQKKGG